MATSTVTRASRRPGRLLLVLGLVLVALSVIGYVLQVRAGLLAAPWYMPVAALVAAGLIVLSLRKARSIWRVLALVFVLLLGAAQATMLLALRLPEYKGPVAAGKPFPAFQSLRADGTP